MIMLICALDLRHNNHRCGFSELNRNTTFIRRASGLFKIEFHTRGMFRGIYGSITTYNWSSKLKSMSVLSLPQLTFQARLETMFLFKAVEMVHE